MFQCTIILLFKNATGSIGMKIKKKEITLIIDGLTFPNPNCSGYILFINQNPKNVTIAPTANPTRIIFLD